MLDSLSFYVENVVFRNEENGYSVLRCSNRRLSRELITVTGIVATVCEGNQIECTGEWIINPKYGRQLKASSINVMLPTNDVGIEKYLSSNLIKGIGKHFAKQIVKQFGDQVFSIIENEPHRLKEIRGVRDKRIKEIVNSWKEHKSIQDIMIFLQNLGLGIQGATRIYKILGRDAIQIIKSDPYQLIGLVKGLGFKTVDKIALEVGVPKDSEKRISAAINHLVLESSSEGHCGLPKEEIIKRVTNLLSLPIERVGGILEGLVKTESLVEDKLIIDNTEVCLIFNKYLYYQERTIAGKLKSILFQHPNLLKHDGQKSLSTLEKDLGIKLANKQQMAVLLSMKCNVLIITGGPGTGKTTILKSIVELNKKHNLNVKLCAPTGRAAKRLSESTGQSAFTIHRLLKIDPVTKSFTYNKDNPLHCDVLIVDESSMIDIQLMWGLVNAIDKKTQFILVGDIDQLPSVGAGRVLSDLIESNALPVIKLDEVFRQAQESSIITNAYRVNKGEMPDIANSNNDFVFIKTEQVPESQETLVTIVRDRLPKAYKYNPIKDIQILSPMQKGLFGVRSLNTVLQKALNPNITSMTKKIELFGVMYAVGDKVMQLENNYDNDVYNGDIGFITLIDLDNKVIAVKFDQHKLVEYQFDDMSQLTLAYATTIHKSQGSEYPIVVLPLFSEQNIMLQRNLLYTAITRGKERVIMMGEVSALNRAVKHVVSNRRYTKLKEWMIENKNYI